MPPKSNHADAFKSLLGSDTVEVVKGPPVVPAATPPATPVTTVSSAPAASAPTSTSPQVTTQPATPETRLPPGVILPQHARPGGGKEDSLRELAKKKEELEAQLAQERAEAANKIKAAEEAALRQVAEAESRLAVFDYASTREFREKFGEPEAKVKSVALAFVKAVKPEIPEDEFDKALDLPAKDFESFLDAQGITAKAKLVELWAERKVIRSQANEAVKSAPARIKALKDQEREQALRAEEFEKKRRHDEAVQYALSLRDRVPGFEDRPGDPTYNQVVTTRRALVASALSEGNLSEQSRDLVIKGALFDEVAEENRRLREELKTRQTAAGHHRTARPLGLPTVTTPVTRSANSHRVAHQKYFQNSS